MSAQKRPRRSDGPRLGYRPWQRWRCANSAIRLDAPDFVDLRAAIALGEVEKRLDKGRNCGQPAVRAALKWKALWP